MSRAKPKKKHKQHEPNQNARYQSSTERGSLPDLEELTWAAPDGLHLAFPGTPPDQPTLELLTRAYQQQIRNSPLWDEMVREFGPLKAEALLKQCRAQLG